MPYYRWIARCRYCGKLSANTYTSTKPGEKPLSKPQIQGECGESPTGKHSPQWEELPR